MIRRVLALSLALTAAWAMAARAGDPPKRWLHIRVEETGDDGDRVRVNVPLNLVEKVLPLIDQDDLHGGRIRINDADIDGVKLRQIWQALREVEDGEYVTVESRDENVRVAREKGYLLVKVSDSDTRQSGDKVNVRIPVTVVDALLSGEGDDLNVQAAVEALGRHGEGELVSVNDDDSTVRIWIDDDQAGK